METMIVIRSIDIVNVPNDWYKFVSLDDSRFRRSVYLANPDARENIEIKTEMVKGKIFVNRNGKKFCIGMSEQVQNAIGLPFEVFESQQRAVDIWYAEYVKSDTRKRELEILNNKIIKLNFWQRLLFAFTKKVR